MDLTFKQLGVHSQILPALLEQGYESPTPIQAQSIPVLLQGNDLLAQAQTGTGKTAAFALPILTELDLTQRAIQALVLTPTRELAIQVAESFQAYAKHLPGFHVLPVYGGKEYRGQLRALKRGVQVIVGTPGRLMDHLRRGTLRVDQLKTLVLDEADEMLKMGFIDDVEWILEQIPCEHQTALFSATLPNSIQKVAKKYLKNATKIHIKSSKKTAAAIEQIYMMVSKNHKLEALTRFLEVEEGMDAALVFTRTKNGTVELAEKLEARGYTAIALNGDMSQGLREKVIARIKKGTVDIVVATDVAARGIDVDRVTHVVNYDIPYDTESYTHRIGRTGRAGRTGKALLLVTPRERHLLRDIERATQKQIKAVTPPTLDQLAKTRVEKQAAAINNLIGSRTLDKYRESVEMIAAKAECSELDVAAALLCLQQQDQTSSVKNEEWVSKDDHPQRKKPKKRGRKRYLPKTRSYQARSDRPSSNVDRPVRLKRRKSKPKKSR